MDEGVLMPWYYYAEGVWSLDHAMAVSSYRGLTKTECSLKDLVKPHVVEVILDQPEKSCLFNMVSCI